METGLTKNERIYLIVTLVVVAAFFAIFKKVQYRSRSTAQFETVEAIDYKMARPEQAYSGYSLEGREIDTDYEGIKAKAKAKAAVVAKAQANAKNKKDGKVIVKKTAALATVNKGSPFSTAIRSPLVHNSINHLALPNAAAKEAKNPNVSNGSPTTNQASVNDEPATDAPRNATNDNKSKKSYAQWRAEIFAKPTKETMTSFITAFRKGEITAIEYQAMAQDLVDQNDANLKGLGLMALRSQPSLASLSQLVHIEAQLSAELQTYVQQTYLAYFQPQNVTYMGQALQTKDKVLVTKSLSLLSTNLQKIKSGDTASFVDSRNRREAASVTLSMNSFKSLLPSLTALSSTSEQDVSSLAQQLVTLIQVNSTAVAGL